MSLIVTLLGGESTGKSSLSRALHAHLNQNTALRAVCVPEHLRLWCEREGRAPRADEQAALADIQARRIAEAVREDVDLVIADTTALVIAAYSERYFGDTRLLAPAIGHQHGYHLHLLMGLDLPWVPDGLFRESPAVRDDIDAILRRELLAAGIAFQTVCGQGDRRLQGTLSALQRLLGRRLVDDDPHLRQGLVPWNCEKCGDPDCEHRLFRRLLVPPE